MHSVIIVMKTSIIVAELAGQNLVPGELWSGNGGKQTLNASEMILTCYTDIIMTVHKLEAICMP